MQAAYFRLEHSSFNRAQFGYGRVAALAHYAANTNKLGRIVSIGLPESRRDCEKRIRELEESQTRKNANLGHGLVISIPKELHETDAERAIWKFGYKVTRGGQSYFRAWEHIDNENNPHWHVLILDQHQETGKPVAKLSANRANRAKAGFEPNATEWLRMQWEDAGNEVFQEHGYDLYLDRRSNLERGLPAPGEHRGYDNDNLDVPPEVDEGEPPTEDAYGEHEMADAFLAYEDEEIATPAVRVQHVVQTMDEKRRLAWLMETRDASKASLARAQKVFEQSKKELQQAEEALVAAQKQEYVARNKMLEQTRNGKPVGFGVTLFGKSFKTAKRKSSEQTIDDHAAAMSAAYHLERVAREHDEAVQRNQVYLQEIDDKTAQMEKQLALLGTDAELEAALVTFDNTVKKTLFTLSLEEIDNALDEGLISKDEYKQILIETGRAGKEIERD